MSTTALQFVDLIDAEGDFAYGLIPVHGDDEIERVDEASVIHDAKSFQNVDYVFFRRFADGRSSQVAAFVIDNSKELLSEADLAKLHHQLWLHGTSPLMYVSWPFRLDILSCARGPDFWINDKTTYRPADRIELPTGLFRLAVEIDEALTEKFRRFSALRLADGTFWDDPANNDLADHEEGAHYCLIQAIVEADQALDGHNKPTMRRLLVLMVLIKYLEDRRVFPDDWFAGFHEGASSFFDVLTSNDPQKVLGLLAALRDKFRGDLFTLPGELLLDKTQLASFATLVEARTLGEQRFLWEQYSFEHLPVEVISRIYQRFVSDGRGAFYTPPMLASVLLDHGLPYDRLQGDERILDPSCGSGIFLVGAFKRLVNVWRHRHGGKAPTVASLKKILRECIFGIELHPEAVNLASFSLALAICDALKPNVIWNQLQFDPILGTNLLHGDFFDLFDEGEPLPLLNPRRWPTSKGWPGLFHLIVGNPPFESALTPSGKDVDDSLAKKRGKLPDKQAAYLFLEQAAKLINERGRVCLLQPSGFLYNRNTAEFRSQFFDSVNCEEILDFTSIRNLFDGADKKTVAVHLSRKVEDGRPWLLHLTFRRTFSAKQRICFELDHYDRHRVPQETAKNSIFIWRANLLGGGRLYEMSKRLVAMRKLEDYIKSKNWLMGEGFIVGTKTTPAPYLHGIPLLPTTALTDAGIDQAAIGEVAETHFQWPRREELFQPPLLLIKENASLPMDFWSKSPIGYLDQIVGIHAKPDDESCLRSLFDTLKSRHRLYQFCCLLNGSKVLAEKATAIGKQDIIALPFPEDDAELDMSFWEQAIIDDVLDYIAPFVRLGQNSELLEMTAPREHLTQYACMFIRMLGSVYDNLKSGEALYANGLICQPFYFGKKPRVSWELEGENKYLERLIYKQNHGSLRTVRVVRFYDKNVMLIVKPDRLRYWIRSTAIRDADETLLDLRRQGF